MKTTRVNNVAIAVALCTGHGSSRTVFVDPSATGKVVIELAELVH
jgi:hypothetical protein